MIRLSKYEPEYKNDFKTLNLEWIEKYYSVCQADLDQLDFPEKIVAEHGEVLYILENEKVVGACALVWYNEEWLELIKMAVHSSVQGKGYGKVLLTYAINTAREKGAKALILETAEELKSAIHIYESHGFEYFTLPKKHFEYNRCVFAMIHKFE
jgi:putative acetyltransferase